MGWIGRLFSSQYFEPSDQEKTEEKRVGWAVLVQRTGCSVLLQSGCLVANATGAGWRGICMPSIGDEGVGIVMYMIRRKKGMRYKERFEDKSCCLLRRLG